MEHLINVMDTMSQDGCWPEVCCKLVVLLKQHMVHWHKDWESHPSACLMLLWITIHLCTYLFFLESWRIWGRSLQNTDQKKSHRMGGISVTIPFSKRLGCGELEGLGDTGSSVESLHWVQVHSKPVRTIIFQSIVDIQYPTWTDILIPR